ncbi:MAG: OmpH family outer membrane protein [Verrucomicrobiae bacterium]|nr:OmpH family outer membrane protein [Verrucomicrobiae bacterium]
MLRLMLTLPCLALATLTATAQSPRVAVIDFEQVNEGYAKSKARFAELKTDEEKIKAELTKEFEGYKQLIEQARLLQKQFNDVASNPAIREAKLKEAQELFAKAQTESRRLQEVKKEKETAYQKKYGAATAEVLGDIQAAATAYAAEKGIDIIFDKSGKTRNAAALVQFADAPLDVTADLVARLNQRAAAAPATAPAP